MKIDLWATLENLFALGVAMIGTLLIVLVIASICYGFFKLYKKIEGIK